ncbi:hypothetical protein B0T16DRAFT_23730 [Cercophora newfieldiana]|uniref:Uncharacterized protein n=1 Tax=Cercophora newfieldiana TaxID=92897 RepID=A0AA39YQE5_9PEZI|nr:hypothetical protein B0T16DRAFT_23730 [Cercophora newfieldiana]
MALVGSKWSTDALPSSGMASTLTQLPGCGVSWSQPSRCASSQPSFLICSLAPSVAVTPTPATLRFSTQRVCFRLMNWSPSRATPFFLCFSPSATLISLNPFSATSTEDPIDQSSQNMSAYPCPFRSRRLGTAHSPKACMANIGPLHSAFGLQNLGISQPIVSRRLRASRTTGPNWAWAVGLPQPWRFDGFVACSRPTRPWTALRHHNADLKPHRANSRLSRLRVSTSRPSSGYRKS